MLPQGWNPQATFHWDFQAVQELECAAEAPGPTVAGGNHCCPDRTDPGGEAKDMTQARFQTAETRPWDQPFCLYEHQICQQVF